MFIPLTGNYRIRELLSSPLVVVLFFISVSGLFLIFCDFFAIKHSVTLILPDHKIELLTRASNVREALKDADIELRKDYLVVPDLSTPLEDTSMIQVIQKRTVIVSKSIPVTPELPVVRKTNLLKKGNRIVLIEQSPGEKLTFYQEVYFNQSLVSRKIIKETLVREPIQKSVLIGTGYSNRLDQLSLSLEKGSIPSHLAGSDGRQVPADSLLYVPDYGYIKASDSLDSVRPVLQTSNSEDSLRAYYIH